MKIFETGNLFDYYTINKYFIEYKKHIVGYINIYPAFAKLFIEKNISKKILNEIEVFFFHIQQGTGYNGYNEFTLFLDNVKNIEKEIIKIFELSSFTLIKPEFVKEVSSTGNIAPVKSKYWVSTEKSRKKKRKWIKNQGYTIIKDI